MVSILITEENIITSKFSIVKNSEEKENFIKDILSIIKNIEVSDLSDIDKLEDTTNTLALSIENAWRSNSKQVNITRHSKSWWNDEYNLTLSNYRLTRSLEDWKSFKSKVKSSKHSFFDLKIQEIANKKRRSWKLMNWVNKQKLPAIKAIKHNVVATTRWNGTRSLLTLAKLSVSYLVVRITRELNKEPSLYYPLYIYSS